MGGLDRANDLPLDGCGFEPHLVTNFSSLGSLLVVDLVIGYDIKRYSSVMGELDSADGYLTEACGFEPQLHHFFSPRVLC